MAGNEISILMGEISLAAGAKYLAVPYMMLCCH